MVCSMVMEVAQINKMAGRPQNTVARYSGMVANAVDRAIKAKPLLSFFHDPGFLAKKLFSVLSEGSLKLRRSSRRPHMAYEAGT
jgi:hypothetical protein